jgi:alkylhydroperoxidase/carboxymuconolactone decarboxylase family protein YurZ
MSNPMDANLEDAHAFSRTWQDGDEPPVLARVLARGAPRRRWQEVLAEFQPDVLDLWEERRRRYRPREIDPRTREFIAIALAMYVDSHHIDNHINAAYEKGATTQELVDVCVLTGNLYGAKAWDIGLAALDRIIEQRTAVGLPVPRDESRR